MTDEQIRESNLKQLQRRFAGPDSAAARGGALIEGSTDAELDHLLRSHLVSTIAALEVEQRDDIDQLLDYYGVLEVASIAACVPQPLPAALQARARAHLNRAAVRRYFECLYPFVLPQLFRERLEGKKPPARASSPGDFSSHFMSFLQVSSIRSAENVHTFLWFLDDVKIKDAGGTWRGIRDFLEVMVDRDRFAEAMTRPTEGDPVDEALHGFVRFLGFARTFDELLLACPDPILRSAFWHHHAYWFQQIGGQLGGVIATAIELQREMVGPSPEGVPGRLPESEEQRRIAATLEDMDSAQRALRRLTSALYRAPLEKIAFRGELPADDEQVVERPAQPAAAKAAPRPRGQQRERARSQGVYYGMPAAMEKQDSRVPLAARAHPVFVFMGHSGEPLEAKRESVDVAKLVGAVVNEQAALGANVNIEMAAPSPMIVGDRMLLTKALQNLVSNAVEFSPPHSPVNVVVSAAGDTVEIGVQDQGSGIPEDERGHIFEPFYSRKPGGSGLGLAMCRQIATMHGGDIYFKTASGKGSVFSLRLPKDTDLGPV